MSSDKAGGVTFDFEIVVDVKMWCGGGCRLMLTCGDKEW